MGEGLAQAGEHRSREAKCPAQTHDVVVVYLGPMNEVPAALCFYRALRVYPSPVELIMSESPVSSVTRYSNG
jgi:hypothetical protein